jgi:lipid II:glycine glycyltransferase (peptidoglycan interpeptide bridge formation enzyme)
MTATDVGTGHALHREIRVRVDDLDELAWSALLGRFADASIYQSWAYGAVHWGAHQLSHIVIERDSVAVAAAQVRLVRVPVIGKGIAYVRWGPLCRARDEATDPEVFRHALRALKEEYVERRGLLLRVMLPIFETDASAAAARSELAQAGFEQDGAARPYRTFHLDLSPPLDVLRKRLDQKWRNCLNNAERNGLTVVDGSGIEAYDRFLEAYTAMMQRKQFETTVDVVQFRKMQLQLLDGLKMRTFVCEKDGRLLNAMVVSALGQTGIYLLGATSNEGLNSKGSYLLQWRVIQWLKENGFRWYDLGGIDPARNPGVFHFKQGLGGQDIYQVPVFQLSRNWTSEFCVRAAERARELARKFRAAAKKAPVAAG